MRSFTSSLATVGVLSASLLLFGCAEDPLPAAEVRSRIATDLDKVLREAHVAVHGTRGSLPEPERLAMFAQVLGSQTPLAAVVRSIGARLEVAPPTLDIDAVVAYVNDQLLDDASYRGDGIFRPSPTRLCADDAACAADLARLDLRIRAALVANPDAAGAAPGSSSTIPALELALQVGATHDAAVTVLLTDARLVVTADLDLLQPAVGALAVVAGASLPNTALSGQLTARIRTDTTGASAKLTIDRPIAVRVAGASGDPHAADGYALTSAAKDILSTVMSQGFGGGNLRVTLGPTTFARPDRGRRLMLDLAALEVTGSFSFLPLHLLDIGVGDRAALLTVDGALAATLDINPDDGRAFDVLVQRIDGIDDLRVWPRIDVRLSADRRVLGDGGPELDVTRLLFDGQVLRRAADRLELVGGTFAITTAPEDRGFTAVPGQCVTTRELPVLAWSVAPCP